MVLAVKVFVIDGIQPYKPALQILKPKLEDVAIVEDKIDFVRLSDNAPSLKVQKTPQRLDFSGDPPIPDPIENAFPRPEIQKAKFITEPKTHIVKKALPPEPRMPADFNGQAKIAIIIDDMGMAKSYTAEIIDLPAPLTLAFLPYADDLDAVTAKAKSHGHELMIHVPMEAMDKSQNIGPVGLKMAMDKDDFKNEFEGSIFNAFDGYVGINNHMGSRLTRDAQAMGWVMENLKSRNLYFIDSKTIGSSVAEEMAYQYGIPTASRDVFLDHFEDIEAVNRSLHDLEKVAYRKGYAIAIGHPKPNTIRALKAWIKTLGDKNLTLVPVSSILNAKSQALSGIEGRDAPQSPAQPPG